MQSLKASFAKLLKPGDDKATTPMAFSLQPVAVPVRAPEALTDDAFGTYGLHVIEQAMAITDNVIEAHDPFATGVVEHLLQQCFAVLDGATPQVVAVRIEQVECEIGEPILLLTSESIVECVDVRHTALIRDRDFTVEDNLTPALWDVAERKLKYRGPINSVSAQEFDRSGTGDDSD
jgi:hypothetical protein